MPIEIRELVIKTSIVENEQPAEKKNSFSRRELDKLKKEIVESCVEQILDRLNKERER